MTEEQMKERLYHAYQLEWLMDHGHSLSDIMKGMAECPHGDLISDDEDNGEKKADIPQIFEEWLDIGFGGEIWSCFDEFCDCELTDTDYVADLISRLPPDIREEVDSAYWAWQDEEK